MRKTLPTTYKYKAHDSYAPYCDSATLFTNKGVRRNIVYLRDSGTLQWLASKETLSDQDYVDTAEHGLIQGVFGIPVEIPLADIVSGHSYGPSPYIFDIYLFFQRTTV